ncbi:hypothetical protein HNR12_000780 [Streptomonospora nanhaiensis]|uniref:Uncharacterized protein n=1 Tax=Streptomonospora nanhaiensis TaxID=1323731 RepID=A0A853BGR2_9ACTN|nr:hypothetical protein [Streptomonospora nanhaiensis]NYI94503.1 hypothetical protein [Streptomonospora nanhaiensis]
MVGAIVVAAFAVIYALVIRKVNADQRAAEMELVESRKALRKKGEEDYNAIEKALTTGEAYRRYVAETALAKDGASVAQYTMAEKLVRQSAAVMERNGALIPPQLAPYMEGDSPRLAYVGPRSRKLELVDDSYLSDPDRRAVRYFIRAYNNGLAVSPRRSFLRAFAAVRPVLVEGRDEELRDGLPADREPPVLAPSAFDDALDLSTPQGMGIRAVLRRGRGKYSKPFKSTGLYHRTQELIERTRARRSGPNGQERRGRDA